MDSPPIHRGLKLRGLLCVAGVIVAGMLLPGGSVQAQSRPTLMSLQAAIDCLSIPTVEVEVPALARGSYNADGVMLRGTSSIVGRLVIQGKTFGTFRDYFVYDLRPSGPNALGDFDLVVGGQLITFNPTGGFQSDSSDTLTYVLNRVSTRISALVAGTAGTAGYLDLADGPVYGSYIASAANNSLGQFSIELSPKAIRDINRSLHNGFGNDFEPFKFAIGGSIANLSTTAGAAFFLGVPVPYASLFLNVKHYGQLCPMPASSQYQ